MNQMHDQAPAQNQTVSGVSTVPRTGEVRVARINRKVLVWTVLVTAAVVALSFVSIVVHGLVITQRW